MNRLIIILSICVLSCREEAPEPEAAVAENKKGDAFVVRLTASQIANAGISFGKPEMREISGTFKASGVLDVPPQQLVSISVPLGGFLKQTEMLEGKRVKKGDLLAVVENPEYVQMQQDYLETRSQLTYAKLEFERQESLDKENINARKTLQQARSAFETLTSKLQGLEARIKASGISLPALRDGSIQSAIRLYAPINGFVTEVNANIGKFVNPTDVLFEIVDTEHLHAELTVFEKDVPRLEIGQRVRFTLANENEERIAKVYLIGRAISKDRTVRVHCHIEKEDIHLLPGMYLRAVIETGHTSVSSLPAAAIVDYEGEHFVFMKSAAEGEFRMVKVLTGNSDAGYTELTVPPEAKDAGIVIKGAYALLGQARNNEEEE